MIRRSNQSNFPDTQGLKDAAKAAKKMPLCTNFKCLGVRSASEAYRLPATKSPELDGGSCAGKVCDLKGPAALCLLSSAAVARGRLN